MQTAAHLIPDFVKKALILCVLLVLAGSARATVQVYVEENSGKAWIKYNCTAGELVRAFALDVTEKWTPKFGPVANSLLNKANC